MLGLIIKIIKTLLESLYVLFEGIPALDALRAWLEKGEGTAIPASAVVLIAGALLLGVAAFILFLFLVRKGSFKLKRVFEGGD